MSFRPRLAVPIALLVAACVFAADGAGQSKRPRVRLGGIMIGAGYSHFSGPFGYPYYAYGAFGPWGAYNWPYYYDPFFYGPSFYPGFFWGYGYGPSMGGIKLKSPDKDAWVYLNGGLAGRVDKLKTIWLGPGVYQLEVRLGDRRFGRKVYVLSGRTLRLTADLARAEVRP